MLSIFFQESVLEEDDKCCAKKIMCLRRCGENVVEENYVSPNLEKKGGMLEKRCQSHTCLKSVMSEHVVKMVFTMVS